MFLDDAMDPGMPSMPADGGAAAPQGMPAEETNAPAEGGEQQPAA